MGAPTFLMNRYAPLNIPQPMNAMHQEYLKLLPRFTGEDEVIAEQHLPLFFTFAKNLNVVTPGCCDETICAVSIWRG